jgi:hypothetical protein
MVVFRGMVYRYAVFITHNWAEDELGRKNHDRAKRINEALKKNGIETWFDEDRMQGDVMQQMLQGIDDSALVLVLVTKKYASKVNGANQSDNCATEFRYILETKEQANMIVPIVMEPCMQNPRTWGGKLQAGVGHLLYKDFSSDDDAVWPVAGLVKQLRDVLATGHTKAGTFRNVQADDVVLTVAIDPVEVARRAAREQTTQKQSVIEVPGGFQVTVPQGVSAGQTFQVPVQGRVLNVVCPRGAQGGQPIVITVFGPQPGQKLFQTCTLLLVPAWVLLATFCFLSYGRDTQTRDAGMLFGGGIFGCTMTCAFAYLGLFPEKFLRGLRIIYGWPFPAQPVGSEY